MTDYFALLNEPRRPWLDPDALKQKFLLLSADVHPDHVLAASEAARRDTQDRYTDLNAAYQCLRDPKERLRHLLELELGAKPKDVQRIPPDLMNLFLEVSQLCRDTDVFLAEKAMIASPLLKVQMFERGQGWIDKLNQLQQKLKAWRDGTECDLKAIDAGWDSAGNNKTPERSAALDQIEVLYRLFSYGARWHGQIQERLVRLSF